MARRGRSRKAGRRTPNGRISRAAIPGALGEPANLYQYIQRLVPLDPIISSQTLCIVCRREDDWSREEHEQVALTVKRAKNPNLSYPAGIAFELGLFRFSDAQGGSHDGRELLQAADRYAGLHRQVWGHLTDDIERALADNYGAAINGSAGIDLLLEVGRVGTPAPPASFFRQLVAGTPAPPGETDPEEYRRKRLRLADRYGEARAVLMRDLLGLNVVEAVVIEGRMPSFLRAGQTLTARGLEDRDALVAGLKALAKHFGLFDDRTDRQRVRADPTPQEDPTDRGLVYADDD
jgi:hypothetical protein